MPIELTPEQERRLLEVLESCRFSTPEEALEAALGHFEGSIDELNQLITEGLKSGPSVEVNDAFWLQLDHKTNGLLQELRHRQNHL